jgi:lipopolysaccharide cholinephosphotransferase
MATITNETAAEALWRTKCAATQELVDDVYDMFSATTVVLDKCAVQWVVICGSALGLARHGGMIPWDDDVDLGCLAKDKDALWAARREFAALGYSLVHADIGFKLGATAELVPSALTSVDGVEVALGAANPFSGACQDFFLFSEGKSVDGVEVYEYTSQRARDTWPLEVLPVAGWENRQPANFGNFVTAMVMSPAHNDWYLERCFGANWRTCGGDGRRLADTKCVLHSSIAAAAPTQVMTGTKPVFAQATKTHMTPTVLQPPTRFATSGRPGTLL